MGVRGTVALSDKFFATFYGDIGAGEPDLTWQALGGIGYRFNERVHATFVYRYMSYDYSSDDFIYDADTEGLGVGLGFSW